MSLLASCSNFARDKLSSMCLGPEASAVMKGKEILAFPGPKKGLRILQMSAACVDSTGWHVKSQTYLFFNWRRDQQRSWSLTWHSHIVHASCTPESSILAFSAASVKRCSACLSFSRSMPSDRILKSGGTEWKRFRISAHAATSQNTCYFLLGFIIYLPQSSGNPLPTSQQWPCQSHHHPSGCRHWWPRLRTRRHRPSKTETSKVPPPKSNTKMVSLFFFSRPYAKDAAVGSFTIRNTSKPAILPASFVAWSCMLPSYRFMRTHLFYLINWSTLDSADCSLSLLWHSCPTHSASAQEKGSSNKSRWWFQPNWKK